MKHFAASVLVVLLCSIAAYAEECKINSASDVLKRAFSNNPEIILAYSNNMKQA